ncbi:MAG: neutral/alkaline non-lysosomal ceramidase N-terminal domain-containing protein [Clostridia bacterium]|nr:neutral/alkaline non-lysosomal ceramidase N-terminal domain-containing protein [Clostridia bacterium]
MKCGFYELDITPAIGSIIPGGFAARFANEILDKLYVRAVVFDNGETTLAIAVVDACGITSDITERIRARVTEITSIKAENIMVMATHAHGGGPTLNWGEEVVTDEHYLRNLVEKSADAIYCAYKKADESEILLGKENIEGISFVRVYQMKDGSFKTNPGSKNIDKIEKTCAEIDPELIVMAVRCNDKFIGGVLNFATHPATIATNEVTGDYISVLCREMKSLFGQDFVTVFINGACGDINHVNPFDKSTFCDGYEAYRRVGKTIAQKAAEAMKTAKIIKDNDLKAISSSVEVKFRKPSKERLMWAKEWFDSLGDELIESTPRSSNYLDTFFALQTFIIQADKRTKRKLDLQVFKIGPCFVFGNPCQLFVNFGKKIKKACGEYCFISAFANDYAGYVPTSECMKEGVYEANLAPTSALEAATGDIVTDQLIEMHNKILNN